MANQPVTRYQDLILRPNREQWPRVRNPPAWAQQRQDMVDAITWFSDIQSGVSLTLVGDPDGLFVKGLLLGGFGGSHSYMDAEILITSLNGNKDKTPLSDTTERRHQAMDRTIKAGRLVGVIIEQGSTLPESRTSGKRSAAKLTVPDIPPLFPCNNMPNDKKTGQNCWVGDYFLPVKIWPTRTSDTDAGRMWMVKLEKYNLEEQSWWANGRHGPPPRDNMRSSTVVTREELCQACTKRSPRIYQEMFVCLNNDCTQLWCKQGQRITEDETLTYTVEFLQERKPRPLSLMTYPPLVQDFGQWWQANWYGPMNRNEQITSSNIGLWMTNLLLGFCCPYCSMLNRRVRWHEWHCRNTTCNAAAGSPFHIIGHPPLLTLEQVKALNPRQKKNEFEELHGYQRTRDLPLFTSHEYTLSEGCYVAYLVPKEGTNAMAGGSDYLYGRMQELANNGTVPLQRRGVQTRAGRLLTGHFAVNYGELYYFSGDVGTIAWDDNQVPREIIHARDMVNDWCSPYRTETENPFNELYLAGYWKGQHMGWHDDGEFGLQDMITTYTLGGQGKFKIRMKPSLNYGNNKSNPSSKRTYITDDPVLPGCKKEAERRELKGRLDRQEITQEQWQEEFINLVDKAPVGKGRGAGINDRDTLLQFSVGHGCLVIMYGSKMQKQYQHCVDVASPMRFAFTFRNITKQHYVGFDAGHHQKKLLYDLEYTPDDAWLKLSAPSQAGDGDSLPPLPGSMQEEEDGEPPRKRPRNSDYGGGGDDDGDDDDDDDEDNNNHDGDGDAMQGVETTASSATAPTTAPTTTTTTTTTTTATGRGARPRGRSRGGRATRVTRAGRGGSSTATTTGTRRSTRTRASPN